MYDLYLYTTLFPVNRIKILFGVHSFWLDDTHDAWYNCYKKIQRHDPAGNASSFVGNECELLLVYRPHYTKHVLYKMFYGHFFASSYVDDTGKSDDADYFYLQIEYKF